MNSALYLKSLAALICIASLAGAVFADEPEHAAMDAMGISEMHDHGAMEHTPAPQDQLIFTPNAKLTPGKSQQFTLQVRSAKGKPVERFAVVHEKLMHLIVVSNDLSYFSHIHPTYQGKGIFKVTTSLPSAGRYTAFADYTPQKGSKQIKATALLVGTSTANAVAPKPDTTLSKSLAGLKVDLLLDPKTVKPGQETPITFSIKDADGQPIQNLQPYLGAMGHLVIIQYSPKLEAASYLHAHPREHGGAMVSMGAMHGMKMSDKPDKPGQVTFDTAFPEPGIYRLWGQFQRKGKVFTADFTIAI
ncbi:hypothetical protein [Anthocerotibacter panamensis]|uniref:hypothetical protein n=1 Tax=Anthocerotibacter panamensis TaxID=2857077 RepID=UPI001C40544A|nr:hypothetical protein [Anthocerotibacter panamensis]